MKTAMQQLLERCKINDGKNATSDMEKGYQSCLADIVKIATELLETEKHQIIKAVLDGSYGNPIMTKEIATKYYNETFKP